MTKNIYVKTYETRRKNTGVAHLTLFNAIKKQRLSFEKIVCESAISAIPVQRSRKIFITNRKSANSRAMLRRNKIVAVISLGKTNHLDQSTIENLSPGAYSVFDVKDLSTLDNVSAIRHQILPLTRTFLSQWLAKGNVLIHCKRGICRSALVVLDYLINVDAVSLDDAARFVVSSRSCVNPTSILLQSLF